VQFDVCGDGQAPPASHLVLLRFGRPPYIACWLSLLRLAIFILPKLSFFSDFFFMISNAFVILKSNKNSNYLHSRRTVAPRKHFESRQVKIFSLVPLIVLFYYIPLLLVVLSPDIWRVLFQFNYS
jgi:hypothetical protein